MAATTAPVITPTTPVITPGPDTKPWNETHTDPARICPQQRREGISPDVCP